MLAWRMQEDIDRLAAGSVVDAPGNDSPFIGQTELKAELSSNDRRYQSAAEVPAGAARAQKNAPGGYRFFHRRDATCERRNNTMILLLFVVSTVRIELSATPTGGE
jgi:hypothetical protein